MTGRSGPRARLEEGEITMRQALRISGLSKPTLRKAIESGELACRMAPVTVGKRKGWIVFRESDVRQFMAGRPLVEQKEFFTLNGGANFLLCSETKLRRLIDIGKIEAEKIPYQNTLFKYRISREALEAYAEENGETISAQWEHTMPERQPDCNKYDRCLSAAAFKNQYLDCKGCGKYQQNKLWAWR